MITKKCVVKLSGIIKWDIKIPLHQVQVFQTLGERIMKDQENIWVRYVK